MKLIHSTLLLTVALVVAGSNCAPKQAPLEKVNHLGLLVKEKGQESSVFVPWVSEQTLQDQLIQLRRAGGGEVQILPGKYEIGQGFEINNSKDIVVRGTEGVQLVFAPEPKVQPQLTKEVVERDSSLHVDDSSQFQIGWNYQVYKENRKGGRILEFQVTAIEGNRLDIKPKVKFMGHVDEIPAGSIIVDHVNFFSVKRSDRISLIGLNMDGIGRGVVHGHTTYCGVIAAGIYKIGERPKSLGLTIKDCSFKRLKGRGIAVYGMGDVLVEGCYFDDVDSQAIELDHFTTGLVRGNEVHNAGVGIALNDAFDSVAENNVLYDCRTAIGFVQHFDHDWVNVNNRIQGNVLIRPRSPGGVTFDKRINGNIVTKNTFIDCMEERRFIRAEGNEVSDNVFIDTH